MLIALIAIFVIAYAAIALEHPIRINKSATALLGAGVLWTIYAVAGGDHAAVSQQLDESVSSTAQIVFFLIGAMTIVEVIDAHNGFEVITSAIRTTRQVTLMWLIGFVTFFLSAILDNLTTTIVMVSLTQKLLANRSDRLFFASHHRDCRECGRRLDCHRRRHDDDAVDRRPDLAATISWRQYSCPRSSIWSFRCLPSAICCRGKVVVRATRSGRAEAPHRAV